MSKDIWHTSNEKPEQLRYYIEEYDRFSDEVGYLVNKRYGVVNTIDDLTTKRWCYLDDLLALETENKDLSDKIGKLGIELERTCTVLDIALCSLQDIADSDGDFITGPSTTLDVHEYAAMMLDKIKKST